MQPPIFLIPGQQLRKYDIYRKSSRTDEKGKVTYSVEEQLIGTVSGSLVKVGQSEAERWKQQGHPITHKIVVRGTTKAKAEDVLVFDGARYYVHAKENRAQLGQFFSLYCEYRPGV